MDIEKEVNKSFKVFHKQVDMFEHQKKHLPKGRCFSFEMPNPYMAQGRRKFFVAELEKFWPWYRYFYQLPRHFYEIIQEGLPCRLYFDLEYKKADNPDLEEEKSLSDFLQFVCALVKETYNIEITEKSFVLLDSTTDQKFSVHATCHFPNNCLFPNNVAMREFIAKLTQKMSETGVGIVKKETEETFICDPAVYTKNRSFRILHSSKCGKKVVFKYRKGCQFYDQIPKDDMQIFLDSLCVPPDFSQAQLLKIVENKGRVLKRNRICHTVAEAVRPITDFAEVNDFEMLDTGVPPSPLPVLDEFVREFNTQFNKAVEIRNWTLIRVKSTNSFRVQYQLNNCKYCLRIEREHVSNNVYWCCQLDREWMFQKCFDHDCKDFISNFFTIPLMVMEEIYPKLEKVFKRPPPPPRLRLKPGEEDSFNVSIEGVQPMTKPTTKDLPLNNAAPPKKKSKREEKEESVLNISDTGLSNIFGSNGDALNDDAKNKPTLKDVKDIPASTPAAPLAVIDLSDSFNISIEDLDNNAAPQNKKSMLEEGVLNISDNGMNNIFGNNVDALNDDAKNKPTLKDIPLSTPAVIDLTDDPEEKLRPAVKLEWKPRKVNVHLDKETTKRTTRNLLLNNAAPPKKKSKPEEKEKGVLNVSDTGLSNIFGSNVNALHGGAKNKPTLKDVKNIPVSTPAVIDLTDDTEEKPRSMVKLEWKPRKVNVHLRKKPTKRKSK